MEGCAVCLRLPKRGMTDDDLMMVFIGNKRMAHFTYRHPSIASGSRTERSTLKLPWTQETYATALSVSLQPASVPATTPRLAMAACY